jgi:hypothetical protein
VTAVRNRRKYEKRKERKIASAQETVERCAVQPDPYPPVGPMVDQPALDLRPSTGSRSTHGNDDPLNKAAQDQRDHTPLIADAPVVGMGRNVLDSVLNGTLEPGMLVQARQTTRHAWDSAKVITVSYAPQCTVSVMWTNCGTVTSGLSSVNVRRALKLFSVFTNIGITAHGLGRTGMVLGQAFESDPLAVQVLLLNAEDAGVGAHNNGLSSGGIHAI